MSAAGPDGARLCPNSVADAKLTIAFKTNDYEVRTLVRAYDHARTSRVIAADESGFSPCNLNEKLCCAFSSGLLPPGALLYGGFAMSGAAPSAR